MTKEPMGDYETLKSRVDEFINMGITLRSIADGSNVNYTALRKWLRERRPLKTIHAEAVEKYMEDFKTRIVQI